MNIINPKKKERASMTITKLIAGIIKNQVTNITVTDPKKDTTNHSKK